MLKTWLWALPLNMRKFQPVEASRWKKSQPMRFGAAASFGSRLNIGHCALPAPGSVGRSHASTVNEPFGFNAALNGMSVGTPPSSELVSMAEYLIAVSARPAMAPGTL